MFSETKDVWQAYGSLLAPRYGYIQAAGRRRWPCGVGCEAVSAGAARNRRHRLFGITQRPRHAKHLYGTPPSRLPQPSR